MINIPTNKPKNDSNRSRIIAVIKNEPGILTRNIEARLPDLTKREIENALHALRHKKSLVCQREPGLPGHWYVLNDPYSTTKEALPPPPKKQSATGDNITPGHLINKMAGPTNGYWRDADWLGCRDGKWRPVEPGSSPLAHGAAARVVRLRAYGNAINAKAAQAFIECVMDSI